MRSKFEEKNTERRKMVEMGHKGVTECPSSVFLTLFLSPSEEGAFG